ncbi:MAG: amidohydrolase family protein [Pseudomonadales bacterium]|jgi:N-acyl-D-aspartate/D-glutamate deacylase|nr:amidohydrolase family protein [Pseudomonadales bacterium]
MAIEHDLVIRGGTVADGSGAGLREADIAIADGVIVDVGRVAGRGAEEVDAKGLLVTPGFVDIHTHYDGQATWDDRLAPSSWHGVTTAVMGNCGVGFAPCRAEDHEVLVRLMEGVEDIPGVVLTEGLAWNWETFPEFLDALEQRRHDIDFAAQVPHGALRVYVMGRRGADREAASPEDVAAMARLAREAVEAGALGFTTSRTLNHQTSEGQPTPTLTAAEDELLGIALALKAADRGVLQFVSDFTDPGREMAMLRRLLVEAGRPLSISLAQTEGSPEGWRKLLGWIDGLAAEGLPIRAQVANRPVGLMLGLDATLNPFVAHPSWREIADAPLAGKVARMRDPAFRARLLSEQPQADHPFMEAVLSGFEKMYELGDPPDYEQDPSRSLGARARARGVRPEVLAYDLLLEDEGRAMLYFPFLNYANDDLEATLAMMRHPHTVLGLGDGGAHLGTICDASFTTHVLTHWTRDRTRGERLPVETVVRWHTQDTAAAVGLNDRGRIARGYKADLNVIDYDRLRLRAPRMVHDLPAGGRRLMQEAEGYRLAVVSGAITYRDGAATEALPGRLVRGARAAPAA